MSEGPKGRKRQRLKEPPAPRYTFAQASEATAAKFQFIIDHGGVALARAEKAGMAMLSAAKRLRKRPQEMAILLERTYLARRRKGHEPTNKEVLKFLKRYDKDEILDDTYDGGTSITWIDGRNKVHESAIGTLENHLSRIRKKDRRS